MERILPSKQKNHFEEHIHWYPLNWTRNAYDFLNAYVTSQEMKYRCVYVSRKEFDFLHFVFGYGCTFSENWGRCICSRNWMWFFTWCLWNQCTWFSSLVNFIYNTVLCYIHYLYNAYDFVSSLDQQWIAIKHNLCFIWKKIFVRHLSYLSVPISYLILSFYLFPFLWHQSNS